MQYKHTYVAALKLLAAQVNRDKDDERKRFLEAKKAGENPSIAGVTFLSRLDSRLSDLVRLTESMPEESSFRNGASEQ